MTWTPVSSPPPGWYPDPGGAPARRWWDGRVWTAHVWPPPATACPGVRAGSQGAGAQEDSNVVRGGTTVVGEGAGTTVPWATAASRGADIPESGAASTSGAVPDGGALTAGSGGTGGSDRRLPPRAAWWALAGVAAGVVLSVLFQGIAYAFDPNSDALIILFGEIGLWTALGGTCLLASRRYGTGRLTDDFGLRLRPSDLATGLAGFLACVIVASVVGNLFAHTAFRGTNTGIIARQKGNEAGLVIVAAIAAVGAPIFEELFFRGFLRRTLESRIGWVGAVWAQAACFGLAHYQPGQGLGAVSVICGTLAIGVVLGYLAHATGRLGAGMVAHGLFNLAVTLSIVLAPK